MLSTDGPFASSLLITGKLSSLLPWHALPVSVHPPRPALHRPNPPSHTCDGTTCAQPYRLITDVSVSQLPCGGSYKRTDV